jgi:hypothetical protein
MVLLKHWIDHRPGGLNRVLTGEERSISRHGVAQKPLIGCFLPRLFFGQVEFALVTDELFPSTLDASGEGDRRNWRELESEIVSSTSR